jgi:2-polyprenyl-6-methoxyphenol hydroxylase-like FAD-dependent oxidoreductase
MAATSASAPILIVGAGPVGLVLAIDLMRRGVPVRIIDSLAAPTTESRAIVIHARTLDQLEAVGVVEGLIAAGVKTSGVQLHADGKRIARVPLDTVASRHPFTLTTAQTETERVLAERLGQLGGKVERGVTLIGLEQDEAAVRASVRHGDNGEERITTPWLIGTDGAHSGVRQATGQKLEGTFQGESFLMGDVDADFDYDRGSFHIFLSPSQPAALLFPMAGRRARLFADIPEGTDVDRKPSAEWLREALAARGAHLKIEAPHWVTRFQIHHGQVLRYRIGRVFLAGDAAHVHSPAGGQGMNTGMQDALNLSWKLALAYRGRASDVLLDSYHDERHPVAAHAITFTDKLTKVGTLGSGLLREMRNQAMKYALMLPVSQHAIANEIEEQNVNYRASPIVAGTDGHAQGGDFLRDVPELAVTGVLQSADVAEAVRHVGIVVPKPDGALPSFDLPAGIEVVTGDDVTREVGKQVGLTRTGGFVAVRPDGYIGLIATATEADAARRYWRRIEAAGA